MDLLLQVLIVAPIFLVVVTFHEYMHGRAALFFGDRTALLRGRLTLNPLAHIDPFGTVIMPLLLVWSGLPAFGYAKPVPVNPHQMRDPRRDMMFVGLAGPFSNFVLAVVGAGLLRVPIVPAAGTIAGSLVEYFGTFLVFFVEINVVIGVFNLLPIPPLDGSRVVSGLLPAPLAAKYNQFEQYGVVLIFLLFLLFGPVLWGLISTILDPIRTLLLGHGIR